MSGIAANLSSLINKMYPALQTIFVISLWQLLRYPIKHLNSLDLIIKPMHKVTKTLIATSVIACIVLFYLAGGFELLNLAFIKQQQDHLTQIYSNSPLIFFGLFFVLYVIATALSLPIASLLTLLAGAIFGFWTGLLLVSFASTLGATCAFLLSRFLLADFIQSRYTSILENINREFQQEGLWYIFALRLVPAFPFFLVNLVMGVMPVSLRHFYLFSQIGMLPGTAVYVYAGTELGKITSLHDITSPGMLVAFTLLGIFPLLSKKLLKLLRKT